MGFRSQAKAFFHIDGDGYFVGNGPATGPWDEASCHAGPVTGLIARALELQVPDKQLFRLTVELRKPVPVAGFKIETAFRKEGRMISTAEAKLVDKNGTLIASAESIHAQTIHAGELPTAPVQGPNLEEAIPGDFPIKQAQHGKEFFSHGIQIAYPPNQNSGLGPTTVWMKSLPLLEGEALSPFQTVCPIADCGNGISRNLEVTEANFLNPDLTVILHRLPESEWVASQARSFWEPTGLGMSQATLFDSKGVIGSALQTLLVQRR